MGNLRSGTSMLAEAFCTTEGIDVSRPEPLRATFIENPFTRLSFLRTSFLSQGGLVVCGLRFLVRLCGKRWRGGINTSRHSPHTSPQSVAEPLDRLWADDEGGEPHIKVKFLFENLVVLV